MNPAHPAPAPLSATRLDGLSVVLIVAALTCVAGCDDAEPGKMPGMSAAAPATKSGKKIVFYRSQMDPNTISTKPGKDSMGMDLVPVYEGDPAADLNTIQINGATMQRMGVRIGTVKRQKLTRVVRALGRLAFDDKRVATVNMKFDGWIERLYVNETGQKVKRGQRMLSVYSPELLASQLEYLQILKTTPPGPHSAHIVSAAAERLVRFDVPRSFVRRLKRKRRASRRISFHAPVGGYVIHKTALEGTFVKTGAPLFTIAQIDALWVLADIYEFDAPWVHAGQDATIEFDYLPGAVQEAKVDYVYPTLNAKTHTLQVRLLLKNPRATLKPGMFATVRIHANPVGETLVLPLEAVIRSGERSVAFVYKGDGRFEPRELKLGVRGDQTYQVLAGLEEGEKIVLSGNFLLDSESRLKEAVKKMLGGNIKPKPARGGSTEGMKGMKGMKPAPGVKANAAAAAGRKADMDARMKALPKGKPLTPEMKAEMKALQAEPSMMAPMVGPDGKPRTPSMDQDDGAAAQEPGTKLKAAGTATTAAPVAGSAASSPAKAKTASRGRSAKRRTKK